MAETEDGGGPLEVKEYGWSELHHDTRKDPFRLFLAVFSLFYGVGIRIRLLAYGSGIFRRRRLPAFVMSIGNLTAGGTGKTPAVEMAATWALEQGYRPAVLSRGYGGRFKGEALVVSDGKEIRSNPDVSGDEPYFLAKRLRYIPVIVSQKRYFGGLLACEKLGADFLILDDGFQHLELRRDLDIVLVDGANPFGNRYLLPRGPLREPVESLERTDVVFLTRWSGGEKDKMTLRYLSEILPGKPIFPSNHVATRVVFPGKAGKTTVGVGDLEGKRAVAFAGIARPDYFRAALESLGMEVLAFEPFRDHHNYSPEEIKNLLARKEHLHAHYLLMTGKDWVKVAQTGVISHEMGYLDIKFKLLDGEEAFFRLVKDAYEKKQERANGSRLMGFKGGIWGNQKKG
ncbi:MAG: tetraacyldisaccharide 4'-kinase [Deltaproteobacteria bacterium]|nr:MAG: tetraacyldisaccharide 4'-kinase [Deltaproteobacteria bacterium]